MLVESLFYRTDDCLDQLLVFLFRIFACGDTVLNFSFDSVYFLPDKLGVGTKHAREILSLRAGFKHGSE